MMRYFFYLITLLFSLNIFQSYSQGVVRGRVSDSSTGENLAGVYVIYGKGIGTSTDRDGFYLIKSDSVKINVDFQFVGYRTVHKSLIVEKGQTVELNIGLETETREINQIVVSADRTEQKISELTVSMDVIKAGFISENHITDAQELINKTSGIEVNDGQVSIRGGSGYSYGVGSRVLALIDGLPLLSPDAGSIKWQFLPLENLSQIEIIKGASSVLYGSSALNGVINFRTSDATNIPVNQYYTEAGIYDNPKNKLWKWWTGPRIYFSGSYSHLQQSGNNDIGLGISIINDNSYRKYNDEKLGRISLRFKHRSKKVKGLNYGLNINTGYTHKTDFILWENAATGALKQDTSSVSSLYGTFISVDPYFSYRKNEKIKHDIRLRSQWSENKFPVRIRNNAATFGFYSEYQLLWRLFGFLNLTTGLSENYIRINSNFFGDHYGLNLAAFSQLEIRPYSKLKIQGGVRLEQNWLDGVSERLVPVFRTGINWQLAGYTFFRASFGQGYRFPSIAEKYASTTLGSVTIFPNPDVQSESGWTSEIGLKQGLLFGETSGQADISVFFSQNKALIEYMFGLYPEGLGFKATNVEQSRIYGTETEFILSRKIGNLKLTATGGYTFIYPIEYNAFTNKNTDIYLKYRRKHTGKLGLGAGLKKFDFGMQLYIRTKMLNIDNVFLNPVSREKILPGFYDYWNEHNKGHLTLDVLIAYKLNKTLSLSFAVKNSTNTEYMGRPGDIQPPRNYSIRLSGKF